jgi:NMD protein affecting ribosome stability and mRNA decay
MNNPVKVHARRLHRHRAVSEHVLGQRAGIPYELERNVCATCGRELSVRPLKRAAAA